MLLTRLIRDVVDFCYPGHCASCRAFCSGPMPLCEPCGVKLDHLASTPACSLCGVPVAYPDAPCPQCQGRGVPHFERVLRLGNYDEPLKGMIHQFKYHRQWVLGEHLTDRLAQEERVKGLLTQTDCLIPVPLHFLRQAHRGFNQAEVIARQIGHRCNIPVPRYVVRTRHTESQTHQQSRADRARNLRGAFRLKDGSKITGKHVVLIDDVLTTGATLQSLARTLRAAKPASLCALVLAVADPKGRGFTSI